MPRSRATPSPLASSTPWRLHRQLGLHWSQFLGLGLYSAFAVNFGIAIALATLGSAIGNDTLIDWSVSVSGDWWVFLLGAGILVLVLFVLCLNTRVIRNLFMICFIPALIGTFVTSRSSSRPRRTSSSRGSTPSWPRTPTARRTRASSTRRRAPASRSGCDVLGRPARAPARLLDLHRLHVLRLHRRRGEAGLETQPRMIMATLLRFLVYLLAFWRYYDIVGQDFTNSVVYLNNNTDDGSGSRSRRS